MNERNSSDLSNFILEINKIDNSVPTDFVGFRKYIKKIIKENKKKKEDVQSLQEQINECQKDIQIAQKMVEDYESQSNLEKELIQQKEINNSLRNQLNILQNTSTDVSQQAFLKNQNKYLQCQITDQQSTINTLKLLISNNTEEIDELKRKQNNTPSYQYQQNDLQIKNAQLMLEITELKNKNKNDSQILINQNKKLVKKISSLKRKIRLMNDCKNKKVFHHISHLENNKEIQFLYQLIQTLKNLNCGCFNFQENNANKIAENHISLHNTIYELNLKNEQLNSEIEALKTEKDKEIDLLKMKNLILEDQFKTTNEVKEELEAQIKTLHEAITKLQSNPIPNLNVDENNPSDEEHTDLDLNFDISLQELNFDQEETEHISKKEDDPQCRGCTFDIATLKNKFDDLENSIDNLEVILLNRQQSDEK